MHHEAGADFILSSFTGSQAHFVQSGELIFEN